MPRSAIAISERELPGFRRQLLGWFHRTKRDLDWRRTRDPYRIWLSEIMLQQTRVAAVIPYYRRFLARLPTVHSLGRARIDVVLRHWAGLGYYSRARNLHRAAQEIVAKHGGEFPRDMESALALPGVGEYTAAAVLSIAYGAPHAVLDGNVARVLARLGAVRGDLRQPRTWRRLGLTAQTLLATDVSGDWNQAMMELGATVCTPRAPQCTVCPVERWCRARALGIADKLPTARQKAKTVQLMLAAAVLLDSRGRTLVVRQQNGDGALFSRLWQFPAIQGSRRAREKLTQHLQHAIGLKSITLEPLATARHAVTYRDIRLAPFLVRVDRLPVVEGARTPLLTQLNRLPVSSSTRKIATAALHAL